MKQRYTNDRYVSIWYFDREGANSDLYIPKAEISYYCLRTTA